MEHLHFPITASSGDTVVVTLDSQANVRLLDSSNYSKYCRGERHEFYGGLVKGLPFRLSVPQTGAWHVAINLGGYAGNIGAGVSAASSRQSLALPSGAPCSSC